MVLKLLAEQFIVVFFMPHNTIKQLISVCCIISSVQLCVASDKESQDATQKESRDLASIVQQADSLAKLGKWPEALLYYTKAIQALSTPQRGPRLFGDASAYLYYRKGQAALITGKRIYRTILKDKRSKEHQKGHSLQEETAAMLLKSLGSE